MPERYVKLSELVEALRAEARKLNCGVTSPGVRYAADFLARSGLGVEGIEVYAPSDASNRACDFVVRPWFDEELYAKGLLVPAVLLLPTPEDE